MSPDSSFPTFVEINLVALRHNFRQARKQAGEGRKLLAIVKADAYGHGMGPVAACLQDEGADFFGVASVQEGQRLREAGIDLPVIILGGFFPGQEEALLRHGLIPILFDVETARRLNRVALATGQSCPFHLKLDTGMGRVGFRPEELGEVLRELSAWKGLRLEGVLSHLALADVPQDPLTARQYEVFCLMLQQIRDAGYQPPWIHLSNSAALFAHHLPECNLVRPGIVLYGALPSAAFADRLDLRPVMGWRTHIYQLKQVPAGTGVSYGHRFKATRPSVLAAIPVGYSDGYNRHLSGCGEVLVRGQRARVAGTVCMNWTMIDVSDIPGVRVGDRVTLLGEDGDNCICAEELAEKSGTISYEIFCQVGKQIPRLYRDEG
ncbi:alanine racemase [Desulfuromonas sp. AOP6]|uniref:alanine racemase n=1 Tax=Desulfuromonas sp. AOP6 TaxID=1566351 RepID=UPI001277842F|nr:alanine racemase [Desulfuromonas sp. AOP6]BCA80561.1 alanine racemase [Desulfuromonas sp. AOP6]